MGGRAALAKMGGKSGRDKSPALHGTGSHPVRSLGCQDHCLESPSPLASCDSMTWQQVTSSAPVAQLLVMSS